MTAGSGRWAGRRAVAVFPHPDDEAWAAGGLLALLARGGCDVTVITLTRGEAGGDPAVRRAELEAACQTLGARPPVMLSLPDGGVPAVVEDRASDSLLDALRDADPDLVVTFGPDGGYGHVDHVACSVLVGAAIAAFPGARLLHCAFDPGRFLPLFRKLRRFRGGRLAADLASDAIGAPPRAGDLVVDITAVADQKSDAIAAHASQLRAGAPESLLPGGVIGALLAVERYTVAAGPPLPPGATDPFAGL